MHERVRLMLLRGDTASARLAIQSLGLDPDHPADALTPLLMPTSDLDMLAIARLLLAEGALDRAMPLLDSLGSRLAKQGRGRRLLQAHLLQSFCHQQRGEMDHAAGIILPHLRQIAQQDVIRSLIDEGPQMATLIAHLRHAAGWRDAIRAGQNATPTEMAAIDSHLDKLAALLAPAASAVAGSETGLGRGLGLSLREIDVLRLLSDGLSNRDLSRSLSISPDTVKWHLKNIFGKLGVESRAQAIVTAQRLRLIEVPHQ
jgi:LuxR family maltose regulon positive regulatory protein